MSFTLHLTHFRGRNGPREPLTAAVILGGNKLSRWPLTAMCAVIIHGIISLSESIYNLGVRGNWPQLLNSPMFSQREARSQECVREKRGQPATKPQSRRTKNISLSRRHHPFTWSSVHTSPDNHFVSAHTPVHSDSTRSTGTSECLSRNVWKQWDVSLRVRETGGTR